MIFYFDQLHHPQAPLNIRAQARQQGGQGPEAEGRQQHHYDAHRGHRGLPGGGAPALHHDSPAHHILEVRMYFPSYSCLLQRLNVFICMKF